MLIGSFELRGKDLLGRVGKLYTKSGFLETPALLPVIDPYDPIVEVNDLSVKMGFQGIMVNAYLLRRRAGDEVTPLRDRLGFQGVISTDSGAYQILEYGEVEVTPLEILEFQEAVSTDIGVILDVPTGYDLDKSRAKWTVEETIRRADLSLKAMTRKDIVWMGPIQGGVHPDLLAYSAREMSRRRFNMLALGSPTQVMERYMFKTLIDMMLTVKMNIPLDRPVHLFGAGHPMMMALAVACGFDTFDSASYALYAKADRYLTSYGTYKLSDLECFPCVCDECVKHSPGEVRAFLKPRRVRFLARHNLWVCRQETLRVKQAILEGRLWELVRQRANSHPALYQAFKHLKDYCRIFEAYGTPVKRRGLFYFSHEDLYRPELRAYREKLISEYSKPRGVRELILIPAPEGKPYRKFLLENDVPYQEASSRHMCFYGVPFGVVPIELDDVYPVSQTEVSDREEEESIRATAPTVIRYLEKNDYDVVYFLVEQDSYWRRLSSRLRLVQEREGKKFRIVRFKENPVKRLKEILETC
ncbi:MAG: tRNA guanosine(15) transglycosylase TgtA [Candidatus Bathyarchaeia archaeon]